MTHEVLHLLKKFYPPEGLFLTEVSNFSVSTTSIIATFNVPRNTEYSIVPLDYVTAEQYVRCFSQLSYGLMYLLSVYHDGMGLYTNSKRFEELMFSGRMWYRHMTTRYLKQVRKGEDFHLSMEMSEMRVLKRFMAVELTAHGPIAVSAEFVTLL